MIKFIGYFNNIIQNELKLISTQDSYESYKSQYTEWKSYHATVYDKLITNECINFINKQYILFSNYCKIIENLNLKPESFIVYNPPKLIQKNSRVTQYNTEISSPTRSRNNSYYQNTTQINTINQRVTNKPPPPPIPAKTISRPYTSTQSILPLPPTNIPSNQSRTRTPSFNTINPPPPPPPVPSSQTRTRTISFTKPLPSPPPVRPVNQPSQQTIQQNNTSTIQQNNTSTIQQNYLYKVVALYDLNDDKCLKFKKGDVIEVYKESNKDWLYCRFNNYYGNVPNNYVKKIK